MNAYTTTMFNEKSQFNDKSGQPHNITIIEEIENSQEKTTWKDDPAKRKLNYSKKTQTQWARYTLSYNIASTTTPAFMQMAQVDGFHIITLASKSTTLFGDVKESIKIKSALLTYLAEQEKNSNTNNITYRLPFTGRVIFRRKVGLVKEVDLDTYLDPEEDPETYYKLEGGISTVREIIKYDQRFFTCMQQAVNSNLCKVTRLDFCVDFSQNIMHLVSAGVQRGRVHSLGSHLNGFGLLCN